MTKAYLEQLWGDEDSLLEKLQWASCMLLKSVAIFRYSKSVVSFGIQAQVETKDLEESNLYFKMRKWP